MRGAGDLPLLLDRPRPAVAVVRDVLVLEVAAVGGGEDAVGATGAVDAPPLRRQRRLLAGAVAAAGGLGDPAARRRLAAP